MAGTDISACFSRSPADHPAICNDIRLARFNVEHQAEDCLLHLANGEDYGNKQVARHGIAFVVQYNASRALLHCACEGDRRTIVSDHRGGHSNAVKRDGLIILQHMDNNLICKSITLGQGLFCALHRHTIAQVNGKFVNESVNIAHLFPICLIVIVLSTSLTTVFSVEGCSTTL